MPICELPPLITRHTPWHELPEWLLVRETAAYLDMSLNGTYELIRTGALPSKRLGRVIRVSREALKP